MTYIEACRVAEENANWIRKHDVERVKRVADLEKARAIIATALSIDPVTAQPEPQDDPPAAERVVAFVHPDDEALAAPAEQQQANGVYYNA